MILDDSLQLQLFFNDIDMTTSINFAYVTDTLSGYYHHTFKMFIGLREWVGVRDISSETQESITSERMILHHFYLRWMVSEDVLCTAVDVPRQIIFRRLDRTLWMRLTKGLLLLFPPSTTTSQGLCQKIHS